MPMLSVDPMPRPPIELRRIAPLDAHEASYLAASANSCSFVCNSMLRIEPRIGFTSHAVQDWYPTPRRWPLAIDYTEDRITPTAMPSIANASRFRSTMIGL